MQAIHFYWLIFIVNLVVSESNVVHELAWIKVSSVDSALKYTGEYY